jgi:hypothetical protein
VRNKKTPSAGFEYIGRLLPAHHYARVLAVSAPFSKKKFASKFKTSKNFVFVFDF